MAKNFLPRHSRYDYVPITERKDYTWPGGKQYLPTPVIGTTTRAFDASEVIAQFFLTHMR